METVIKNGDGKWLLVKVLGEYETNAEAWAVYDRRETRLRGKCKVQASQGAFSFRLSGLQKPPSHD
jgi:hypothetical protein